MTRRALLFASLSVILAAVSSCSYGWRYVVVNNSLLPMRLEYRLRPDSADACPRCQLGFAVPQPRWIAVDSATSSGYCWKDADSAEYTVELDGRDLRFQISVPPAGMVEIYEHALKRMFRKQTYWYALKVVPS
jgi:hypothetical protein